MTGVSAIVRLFSFVMATLLLPAMITPASAGGNAAQIAKNAVNPVMQPVAVLTANVAQQVEDCTTSNVADTTAEPQFEVPIDAQVFGPSLIVRDVSAEASATWLTLVYTDGLNFKGGLVAAEVVAPEFFHGQRAVQHRASGETHWIAEFTADNEGGPYFVTAELRKGSPTSTPVFTKIVKFWGLLAEDPRPSCVTLEASLLDLEESANDGETISRIEIKKLGDPTTPFTVELELSGTAVYTDYQAVLRYGPTLQPGVPVIVTIPSYNGDKRLDIATINDELREVDEFIIVRLKATPGIVIVNSVVTLRIRANDGAPRPQDRRILLPLIIR